LPKSKEQEIKDLREEVEVMLLTKIMEVGYSTMSSYVEIYKKFKEALSYGD
jgi:hypothetical protein